MINDFESILSVQKGVLSIDSSWGKNPSKSVGAQDVRYILLSPHDTAGEDRLGLDALPDTIKDLILFERSLLEAYLHSERDAGIDELRQEILRNCRGGVSVSAQINRGVLNFNRDAGTKEMPPIWQPEQLELVAPTLSEMHRTGLADIDSILNAMGDRVRIVCLHSMDPWNFVKGARPDLSHQTMAQYVAAQRLPMNHKTLRVQDFITGQEKGSNIADQPMYKTMGRAFDARGISHAPNNPYDTDIGWPDYQYMLRYPRRVSAVDLTKTTLCDGEVSAEEFTYNPTNPQPNKEKVADMARVYTDGINCSE